jgi:hypothetical protein
MHVGNEQEKDTVITVVGVADAGMAGMNVLLGGGVITARRLL